jgi:hypothetical protein
MLGHFPSCSNEASVINGQLSSSSICNVSFTIAELETPKERMPSSVIHSQRDSVLMTNEAVNLISSVFKLIYNANLLNA